MASIDFFTFITNNSSQYADFLYKCANSLKSGKHDINWKYIMSGETEDIPLYYKQVAKTGEHSVPSMAHAYALNKAIEKCESDYVILVDSDISLLYRSWDDIVVKKIKNECDLFGFGVESSGWNRPTTIPSVMFFCFRRNIINYKSIDFSPIVKRNGRGVMKKRVVTELGEKITGHPIGCNIECETGYKIAELVYRNGWKANMLRSNIGKNNYELFNYVSDRHKKRFIEITAKSSESMAEWYFGKELFGAHLRKGRDYKYGCSKSIIWTSSIVNYLKNKYDIDINRE